MHLHSPLDCVEMWVLSLRESLELMGITVHFARGSSGNLNPSCSLNFRQGSVEADFVVWESGEAELALAGENGVVEQTHFDDLQDGRALASALSRVAKAR